MTHNKVSDNCTHTSAHWRRKAKIATGFHARAHYLKMQKSPTAEAIGLSNQLQGQIAKN